MVRVQQYFCTRTHPLLLPKTSLWLMGKRSSNTLWMQWQLRHLISLKKFAVGFHTSCCTLHLQHYCGLYFYTIVAQVDIMNILWQPVVLQCSCSNFKFILAEPTYENMHWHAGVNARDACTLHTKSGRKLRYVFSRLWKLDPCRRSHSLQWIFSAIWFQISIFPTSLWHNIYKSFSGSPNHVNTNQILKR